MRAKVAPACCLRRRKTEFDIEKRIVFVSFSQRPARHSALSHSLVQKRTRRNSRKNVYTVSMNTCQTSFKVIFSGIRRRIHFMLSLQLIMINNISPCQGWEEKEKSVYCDRTRSKYSLGRFFSLDWKSLHSRTQRVRQDFKCIVLSVQ